MVFNYCDMSPWEYILGCFTPQSALKEPRMVSYHATHVFGWPAKKGKLKSVKLWANCNESEIIGITPSPSLAAPPVSSVASILNGIAVSTSTPAGTELLTAQHTVTTVKKDLLPLSVRLRQHAGLYKRQNLCSRVEECPATDSVQLWLFGDADQLGMFRTKAGS